MQQRQSMAGGKNGAARDVAGEGIGNFALPNWILESLGGRAQLHFNCLQ